MVYSNSIEFSIHTFQSNAKLMETLFGEPIAQLDQDQERRVKDVNLTF